MCCCIQLYCNILCKLCKLYTVFPDLYLGNTWEHSTFHNPLFFTDSHQVQSIVAAPTWTKSVWPSPGVCVTFHLARQRPSSAWQELSDSPRKPKSESASRTEASPRWWDETNETDLQPPATYLHTEPRAWSSPSFFFVIQFALFISGQCRFLLHWRVVVEVHMGRSLPTWEGQFRRHHQRPDHPPGHEHPSVENAPHSRSISDPTV